MLYISRVSIKNYRRLRNVKVPLKPHSVVIGENNAGKSSLLGLLEIALNPTRRFPLGPSLLTSTTQSLTAGWRASTVPTSSGSTRKPRILT